MLESTFNAIAESGLAVLVRDSLWGYPIFETIHLTGIVLMFGSIALVDLRYLGFGKGVAAFELGERHLLRFTWVGFILVVLSGVSLFSAYPFENFESTPVRLKFLLIALAGVNMLFFNFRIARGLANLPADAALPLPGRVSVALSLALWTATIACGRLIAYPEMFE